MNFESKFTRSQIERVEDHDTYRALELLHAQLEKLRAQVTELRAEIKELKK